MAIDRESFGIIQLCYSSLVARLADEDGVAARGASPLARRRLDLAGRLPLLELARVDGDVSADENDSGARGAEDDGAALRLREGSGDALFCQSGVTRTRSRAPARPTLRATRLGGEG